MRKYYLDEKTVCVSVTIDDVCRYEFTVVVPPELEDDSETCSLVGTNSLGENFKLGALGIGAMWLLQGLGHAQASENRPDVDGYYWKLKNSRRHKWK